MRKRLNTFVQQAKQAIGIQAVVDEPSAPTDGIPKDWQWAVAKLTADQRAGMWKTYRGTFGDGMAPMLAWLLNRWSRSPDGSRWAMASGPIPPVVLGRAGALVEYLLMTTRSLLDRCAQIAYQGDMESAVQSAIKDMMDATGWANG